MILISYHSACTIPSGKPTNRWLENPPFFLVNTIPECHHVGTRHWKVWIRKPPWCEAPGSDGSQQGHLACMRSWGWWVRIFLNLGSGDLPSMKLTNSKSPLKIGRAPKGNSSSNHPFSGAMLVPWRVFIPGSLAFQWYDDLCLETKKPEIYPVWNQLH